MGNSKSKSKKGGELSTEQTADITHLIYQILRKEEILRGKELPFHADAPSFAQTKEVLQTYASEDGNTSLVFAKTSKSILNIFRTNEDESTKKILKNYTDDNDLIDTLTLRYAPRVKYTRIIDFFIKFFIDSTRFTEESIKILIEKFLPSRNEYDIFIQKYITQIEQDRIQILTLTVGQNEKIILDIFKQMNPEITIIEQVI